MSARRKAVRWLISAQDEFLALVEQIASDKESAAERFFDRLLEKIELLGDSPHLGAVCPYFRRVGQLIHGKYVIYYTVHRTEVVIRAVVHGARLFRSHWLRRDD